MIKSLIGMITLPKDAVKYHGEMYIPCIGMPTISSSFDLVISYDKKCNYRKIEQNFFGVWEESNSWLGLNGPIDNEQPQ